MLYRAMLWAAKKENMLLRAFSESIYTECHYYPIQNKYAIINNSDNEQRTLFYDFTGKSREITLKPSSILWI